MAESYVLGCFAFCCTPLDGELLTEAVTALGDIMRGNDPPSPSAAMTRLCPASREGEPWSGLVDLVPNPDCPWFNADFMCHVTPDDPASFTVCISSLDDFHPLAVAQLIHCCCRETLAASPIGFEWAATCSRPWLDEFGGGWCVVFADRILCETTGGALARALESEAAEAG